MPSKYENFISMIAFLQLLDGMTWNGVMIIKNLWEHKCKRKSYIVEIGYRKLIKVSNCRSRNQEIIRSN